MKKLTYTLLLSVALLCASTTGAENTYVTNFVPYPHIAKAIEEGNMMAIFAVGQKYLKNAGMERCFEDTIKGRELLERAFAAGVDSAGVQLVNLARKLNDDNLRFRYSKDGELAQCYLYGIGTTPNPKKALEIYNSDPMNSVYLSTRGDEYWSIKNKSIESHLQMRDWLLADMLVRRNANTPDEVLEQKLLNEATITDTRKVTVENADAMADLAIFYGPGTEKGESWLIKAYECKSAKAAMMLLSLLSQTEARLKTPVSKKPSDLVSDCFSQTLKSAKANDAMACMTFLYLREAKYSTYRTGGLDYGYSTNKRSKATIECRKILASMGYPAFQYDCYKYRYETVKPKHIQILLKSAENGYGPAAYELGLRYYDGGWMSSAGKEYARNLPLAFKWFNRAAELGYTPAFYEVGYMYENGEGVEANQQKAIEFYLKAVNHPQISTGRFTENTLRAASKIAYAYESGNGLEQDLEKALIYYQLASLEYNNGLVRGEHIYCPTAALYKLGEFYDYGKGVDEYPAVALGWYERARRHEGYTKLPKPIQDQINARISELKKTATATNRGGVGYYNMKPVEK